MTQSAATLETGLRGVEVGYCPTSYADPEKGLHYGGRPLSEVAQLGPESVLYLLAFGHLPSEEESQTFWKLVKKRARLSKATIESIRALPRDADPVKLWCASLLIAGATESQGDYLEDCLDIIAKSPLLAAEVINHHAGWGKTPESDSSLGYMQNFSHLLQPPQGVSKGLGEVFSFFNSLHYDHGGGNLSCFVGKAIASGLEDMYGSLAGAMAALSGSRHGRANQDSLEFVKKIHAAVGDKPTEAQVAEEVRKILQSGGLIYGFGHAVLRVEDPRATLLYALAEKHYSEDSLVKTALALRGGASQVLKENPKIQNPYPNVDAISGTVLSAAGFPYPDYYCILFGMSRVVGIALQIVYERLIAREGKGTPIMRPKYSYRPVEGGVLGRVS